MPATTRTRVGGTTLAALLMASGCGGREQALPGGAATEGSSRLEAGTTPTVAAPEAGASASAEPCTTDSIDLVVAASADQLGPYSLEAFHPADASVRRLGSLVCSPIPGASAPVNALAVDRAGTLYAAYGEFGLVRIDATAGGFACHLIQVTGAFQPFGIAFVGPSASERLFVISDLLGPPGEASNPLGVVDPLSGALTYVNPGATTGVVSGLTGTGDGRLFGISDSYATETIAEIDPKTGSVARTLPGPEASRDWLFGSTSTPFVFWGGDFYFFPIDISSWGTSVVLRFHPGDAPVSPAATMVHIDGFVVAATASTCAPLK